MGEQCPPKDLSKRPQRADYLSDALFDKALINWQYERMEHLQRENDTCGLQCSATMKSLLAENEQLRTALAGISTCSTCEACRGAATRALGGVEIKPSADAQRWAFFRKHHLSDYQGKRVHQWLMDNLLRADGIDAAIDELIRVSETTEATLAVVRPEEC